MVDKLDRFITWLFRKIIGPLADTFSIANIGTRPLKVNPYLAGFLSLSLIIRLTGFDTSAIWFDEWISKYRAQLPWNMYLTDTSDFIRFNLWEVILRPFATGPVWLLRLPALICSMLALWLGWKIVDELQFNKYQRTIAASGMALLPGLIWVSQDARYYAGLTVLYMAAAWFALRNRWLGLFACCGLLFYIHPIGPAFASGALALSTWKNGISLKRLVVFPFLLCASWLPEIANISKSLYVGRFWLGALTVENIYYSTLTGFFVSTIDPISPLGVLVVIGLAIIASWVLFRFTPQNIGPAILLLIPYFILLIESALWENIFFYRPLTVLGIPFALTLGSLIAPKLNNTSPLAWYPALLAGFVFLIGIAHYDASVRGGDLQQLTDHIRRNWQAGDVIVYTASTIAGPVDYYLHDLNACLYPWPGETFTFRICEASDLKRRAWLLWPRDPYLDPALNQQMTKLTADLVPMWTITSNWQMSPTDLYLLNQ